MQQSHPWPPHFDQWAHCPALGNSFPHWNQTIVQSGLHSYFWWQKCDIVYNGNIISQGFEDQSTDLWTLPIPKGVVGNTQQSDSVGPHSAHMVSMHGYGGLCNVSNLDMAWPLYRSCPPPFPPSSACHAHTFGQHTCKCCKICTSVVV